MSERVIFLRSLAIGSLVGLAVSVTSYLCAFANLRTDAARAARIRLLADGFMLDAAVTEFVTETGRFPERLEQVKSEYFSGRIRESGAILDQWGHPYEYRREGDSYTIRTLGHDGRPGGIGIDEDHDYRRGPRFSPPTLWQFTFQLPYTEVKIACALLGPMVLVVCIRDRLGAPENARLAMTSLPVVFVMTVGMATIISMAHATVEH